MGIHAVWENLKNKELGQQLEKGSTVYIDSISTAMLQLDLHLQGPSCFLLKTQLLELM